MIITHKDDYTVDFVVNKLNARSIPFYRLNCEEIHKVDFKFDGEEGGDFQIKGIASIKSIWFRRTKLPLIEGVSHSEKMYLLGEYDALLDNIYQLLRDRIWLSHPDNVYRAENKLYQLKIARKIGFNLPDTIVSNQHEVIKNFIRKHKNNVIIKPLNQGRIITEDGVKTIFTNKMSNEVISNLDNYDLTPSIIQENIEKEYELRVTIVNQTIWAAKVDSQFYDENKVDWRKKKIPFEKYSLPKEIENLIHQLIKVLNLNFCAIDFIKYTKGKYVFLEINPNGQWAWLESEIGLPISDEIINFLDC